MNAEIVARLELTLELDADEKADPGMADFVAKWQEDARRQGNALRSFARTVRSFEAALQRHQTVLKCLERLRSKDGVDDFSDLS